MAIES